MYHLVTFPTGFGELSYSPFCVKAMWMLNVAGVDWMREDTNDPRRMPHGKLPVLRTDDRMIHDSGRIGDFLISKGADFWGDTALRDRALGLGMIRMAEQDLYFHAALDRWGDDAVWPVIRDSYFSDIPRILRGVITGKLRKDLMRGMRQQGIGRLSPVERFAALEDSLDAISTLLRGHDYVLGDRLTLPDFSVAAMLAAMAASPVPTAQSRRLGGDAVLMEYVMRVKALGEP